jgi:hypothetical protein
MAWVPNSRAGQAVPMPQKTLRVLSILDITDAASQLPGGPLSPVVHSRSIFDADAAPPQPLLPAMHSGSPFDSHPHLRPAEPELAVPPVHLSVPRGSQIKAGATSLSTPLVAFSSEPSETSVITMQTPRAPPHRASPRAGTVHCVNHVVPTKDTVMCAVTYYSTSDGNVGPGVVATVVNKSRVDAGTKSRMNLRIPAHFCEHELEIQVHHCPMSPSCPRTVVDKIMIIPTQLQEKPKPDVDSLNLSCKKLFQCWREAKKRQPNERGMMNIGESYVTWKMQQWCMVLSVVYQLACASPETD